MTIQAKLVLAVAACTAAVGVAVALAVGAAQARAFKLLGQQAVASAGGALVAMEQADVEKLDATLEALKAHPGLAQAFAAGDRERLLALAAPIFDDLKREHDVTHLYFIRPDRTCFLRVHKPGQSGDVIRRATLEVAATTGLRGAGMELGKTAFALRVVEPWRVGGELLGYLELGEEIDHFLGRMKAQTRDDYGLLLDKARLDRADWAAARGGQRDNWGDRPGLVVADATGDEALLEEPPGGLLAVPPQGLLLGAQERDGRYLVRGLLPVKDASGAVAGALHVRRDLTALHDAFVDTRWRVVSAVVACALALAALLLLLVRTLVFARLRRMTEALQDASERLAGGDTEVTAPPVTAQDELAPFERSFGGFVQLMAATIRELTGRQREG